MVSAEENTDESITSAENSTQEKIINFDIASLRDETIRQHSEEHIP